MEVANKHVPRVVMTSQEITIRHTRVAEEVLVRQGSLTLVKLGTL